MPPFAFISIFTLLYHLKILQRLSNCFFFFYWTLRLLCIFCFWKIEIFSHFNTVLFLDLCYIKATNLKARMF